MRRQGSPTQLSSVAHHDDDHGSSVSENHGQHKLSLAERKVLAVLQMDWRQDVPTIAQITELSARSVSHALKRLRERDIMRPFVLFNQHALGLTDYCVFFNVLGLGEKVRDKVLEYMKASPQTTYIGELSGRYHYTASIMAASIFEVETFFDGLIQRVKQPSIDLSFAIRAQWSIFPLKYLDPVAQRFQPLTRTHTTENAAVDEVDERILVAMGREPDLSVARLAAIAGIPSSTLRYRLDSLARDGVIIGFPCRVDGARLGMHPFRILIVARGMNATFRQELFRFAEQHRLCTGFVRCLGAWDFELNYDLERIGQGGEVLQEIYDHFGAYIQSTSTVVDLRTWKFFEWSTRRAIRLPSTTLA